MSTTETVQEVSPLERTIELTVAAKEVEAATDARLARMGKTLKIAGFRPGKVPAKVVKQHHGLQAREEALNELVGRAYGEAITASLLEGANAAKNALAGIASTTQSNAMDALAKLQKS